MMQKKASAKQKAKAKSNSQTVKTEEQKTVCRNWFYSHIRAIEYVSLGAGGILAATLSPMSNANMSAAVWTTFAAVVFFAFGGACWFQKYLWDAAARSKPPSSSQHPIQPNSSMSSEHPNIRSTGQSGGFTGVNQGTVNLGSPNTDAKLDQILAKMDAYQKRHAPDLSKEFPLGYSLFTMKGRSEIIPYQVPSSVGAVFHWDTASVQVTNQFVSIKLPNVDFAGGGRIQSMSTGVPNQANASANAIAVAYKSSDGTMKTVGLVFKLVDSESGDRMGVLGLKFVPEP